MSTEFNSDLLDSVLGDDFLPSASEEDKIPLLELRDGEIDPRYLRSSYSTGMLLHKCPRKFQLKCLSTEKSEDISTNITFAFGHAVGYGIAELVSGTVWNQVMLGMFLQWDVDYLAENDKQKKSFALAVHAIQMFRDRMESGYLEEYDIARWKDKPAVELSFRVEIPGRYGTHTYRGYLDAVLRHRATGELVVLENKTSSGTWVNHYQYKNSAQALGYSVVLDALEGELSAYEVLYNIYMTKLMRYEDFPFQKTYHMRSLWVRDLLWDVQTVETLVEQEGNYGIWPMRGESCTDFGRACEYMDICQFDTRNLMKPLRESHVAEDTEYDIEVKVEDLI